MNKINLFVISIVIFCYHALLSPTISNIMSGNALEIINSSTWISFSLAILTWVLLPQPYKSLVRSPVFISKLELITIATTIISLFLLHFISIALDKEFALISQNTSVLHMDEILEQIFRHYKTYSSLAGGLPFFVYGFYIAIVMSVTSKTDLPILLIIEFSGMFLGFLISIFGLDLIGIWERPLQFALIFSIITIFVTDKTRSFSLKIGLIALFTTTLLLHLAEPYRDIHLSARDFKRENNITELERAWNSYSKIQVIEVGNTKDEGIRRFVSIGDGKGWVTINDKGSETPSIRRQAIQVGLTFKPKKSLILFAGAGIEIMSMALQSDFETNITGVEINPNVIFYGHKHDKALTKFFKDPHYKLINMDAREFLSTSKEKFDSIIYAFATTAISNIGGALVTSSHYPLTKEALLDAWNLLSDDGVLIFSPSSKVILLATLKELEKQKLIRSIKENILILTPHNDSNWKNNFDAQILVVKKSPITEENIESLKLKLRDIDFDIAVTPNQVLIDSFSFHYQLIKSDQSEPLLKELNSSLGMNFGYRSDDFPNVFNVTNSPKSIFNIFFYENLILTFLFAAIFCIFLCKDLSTLEINNGLKSISLSFAATLMGIGLTGIQTMICYKLALFAGNPTFALLISMTTAMGGSICSLKLSTLKLPRTIYLLMVIIPAFVFYNLLNDNLSLTITQWLLSCSRSWRFSMLFSIFFITSTCLSMLYPLMLKKSLTQQKTLQLIGMEALGCGFIAGSVPSIFQSYGFSNSVMFYLAATILSGGLILGCRKTI